MEVYISITNSTEEKKVVRLPDFPIKLGRGKENHVTICDDLCSTNHILISKTKDSVLIKDLNSKNGVALNGIKVFNQRLYIKDEVKIGNTLIKIEKEKLCEKALELLSPNNNNRLNGEITIELEVSKKVPVKKPKMIETIQLNKKHSQERAIYALIGRCKTALKKIDSKMLFKLSLIFGIAIILLYIEV